jgi:hypothetical protein
MKRFLFATMIALMTFVAGCNPTPEPEPTPVPPIEGDVGVDSIEQCRRHQEALRRAIEG